MNPPARSDPQLHLPNTASNAQEDTIAQTRDHRMQFCLTRTQADYSPRSAVCKKETTVHTMYSAACRSAVNLMSTPVTVTE